jgi:predicted nuclease with TOPRIM domain
MMLEQSLAALQPMLAMGQFSMSLEAASLTDSFQRLVGDVNSLRHTLSKLEATQEEVEAKPVAKLAKSDSDDDEEDDDAADDDDDAEAADEADATLASNDALGATPKPKPDEAP